MRLFFAQDYATGESGSVSMVSDNDQKGRAIDTVSDNREAEDASLV